MGAILIQSVNYSGYEANIIFTPSGSEISYGLGTQIIPYIFDSSILGNNININGKYSINILDTNCSYILVV
jgi:hypothetical protein